MEHVIFRLSKLSNMLSDKEAIARSIELFVLEPYCEGFKISFLSKNFLILASKIFSNILEKIGNKAMGRKSPNERGDGTFGIGITYAVLNSFGKVSRFTHLLNNSVKTGDKTHFASLTNFAGI